MRFLSRSAWQIGALAISVSLFNACSSGDSDSENVEPVEAGAAEGVGAEHEGAVPPPAAVPAPVQQEQIAAPIDTPAATTAPAIAGSATRRVMYVKSSGTPVREKANSKAKILNKLNRGDHILVNIEGEWARLDQGGYIAMKGLSEKGIAPVKGAVRWSGGRPGAVKPAKPNPNAPVKAPPAIQDAKPAAAEPTPPPPHLPSADSPAGAGVAPDTDAGDAASGDSAE